MCGQIAIDPRPSRTTVTTPQRRSQVRSRFASEQQPELSEGVMTFQSGRDMSIWSIRRYPSNLTTAHGRLNKNDYTLTKARQLFRVIRCILRIFFARTSMVFASFIVTRPRSFGRKNTLGIGGMPSEGRDILNYNVCDGLLHSPLADQ